MDKVLNSTNTKVSLGNRKFDMGGWKNLEICQNHKVFDGEASQQQNYLIQYYDIGEISDHHAIENIQGYTFQ